MTATPSAPVIDLVDLKIEAKSNDQWSKIVNGVSLSIRPGEVLGLVGESGAGKSTVGLAALGYFRPGAKVTGGEVRLLGQNILDIPEEERRKFRGTKVAYVAQSAQAAFNPAYRLMDQIIMVAVDRGGLTREAAQKRALDLFHALQLPDPRNFGKRYPHQVSGGQLQRAMVAMAMICNPALIIFDEPTTALDVTTQIDVLAAIKDAIRDTHVAALYITHDLAVVAQVADEIMVLRHGKLVEWGGTRQIIKEPRQEYTNALVSVHEIEHEEQHAGTTPFLSVKNVTAAYGDNANSYTGIAGGTSVAGLVGNGVNSIDSNFYAAVAPGSSWSALASYKHVWTPAVWSAVSGGYASYDGDGYFDNTTIDAYRFVASTGWTPVTGLDLMFEGMYSHADIDRAIADDNDGDAWAANFWMKRSW